MEDVAFAGNGCDVVSGAAHLATKRADVFVDRALDDVKVFAPNFAKDVGTSERTSLVLREMEENLEFVRRELELTLAIRRRLSHALATERETKIRFPKVIVVHRRCARALHSRFDSRTKLLRMEWLVDVIIRADREALHHIRRFFAARDEKNRDVFQFRIAADLFAKRKPIAPRKTDVDQDQIESLRDESAQRFIRVRRAVNLKTIREGDSYE